MDTLIDQVLNQRYHLRSKLSQMPGSRTFLATDLSNDTSVVVKLLLFDAEFTWESLKLFEREAAALKDLNHPAVPEYLDFADVEVGDRKGFLLVQTYIEAPSLQDWLKQGRRFSEAELKQITKTMLEILTYLHSRKPSMIHRDIKPSNVLLSDRSGHRSGQIYLVDFGAIQGPQHAGTVTIVGTYGYMPLEQFGGRALPASDLYSLGATLVYLATGQHPADLPQQDMRLQFADRAQLSTTFSLWLQWLLEPDISKRPRTAQCAFELFDRPPNKLAFSQNATVKQQRPDNSFIVLDRNSDSLTLEIPGRQFEKTFHHAQDIANRLIKMTEAGTTTFMFSAFLSIFGVGAVVAPVAIPVMLWMSISLIFSLLLRPLVEYLRDFSTPNRYYLKLMPDKVNGGLSLKLSKKRSGSMRQILAQNLVGISAGPYDRSRDRINFICDRASAYSLYLKGSHQEVQWLCNELNRWTGWFIDKHDHSLKK